jgi:hypothetical protein
VLKNTNILQSIADEKVISPLYLLMKHAATATVNEINLNAILKLWLVRGD